MQIGQIIKKHRIAKGMTQQELSVLIKSNVRTIQRIENDEVTPRQYTLRAIATILDIEFSSLINQQTIESNNERETGNKKVLFWLHLSGFLFLPAVMIWFFEKNHIKDVDQHGKDVINFQLSMLTVLIPCLALPFFFPLLIGLFASTVILINTFRVSRGRPYHYPLTISFLRP